MMVLRAEAGSPDPHLTITVSVERIGASAFQELLARLSSSFCVAVGGSLRLPGHRSGRCPLRHGFWRRGCCGSWTCALLSSTASGVHF